MSTFKDETKKEFVCRACEKFLDSEELIDGKCPICNSNENIFNNDLLEESEEDDE